MLKFSPVYFVNEYRRSPSMKANLFVLISIGITAVGCGTQTQTSSSREQPDLPSLSETYSDVAEAIQQRYDEVVANPVSGDAWGKYGMVLDAHEFRDESIPCYKRAVELQPDDPKWAWLLASRIQQMDSARALQLLEKKPSDPAKAVVFLVLEESILEELGLTGRADSILENASETEKANAYIKLQIARRLFEKSELSKARDLLNHADSGLPLSHRYRDAAQLLARIDQSEGRGEEAAKLLRDTESLPMSRTSITNPFMNELALMRRDPLWLGERAAVDARNGSLLARSELQSLVQRFPEVVPNRIHMALLLLEEKQFQQAEQLLKAGLEVSLDDERLLMTLAAVNIDRGDWEAAELGLRHLLKLNTINGAAWSDLGFVLEQQSKWADAEHAYEQALQMQPEESALRDRLWTVQKRLKLK